MRLTCFLFFILFPAAIIIAQEKKSVEAYYIESPLTIDGILDETAYTNALPAKDFVQLQPYNGKPSFQESEVYFFYDQSAVYVGAMLFDNEPDSIFNYLTQRDNTGMSDYFGVYFDPYNQGQLAYGFFITPAGVQIDLKAAKSGDNDWEDSNWDAVWQSKTLITEKGWVVEMKIPYSALRFPEKGDGIWGLNMFRNLRRYNSNNSWSFIDRNVSGFLHQEGQLIGIKDIKSPVRLSLSPYAATYAEYKTDGKPKYVFKGGMDLKYGISDAFTLDMMLIPDFGQIQSDDKRLNLSPFELYYSEKRQFFTEGTELFDRADLFYSRRIGATPKFSDSVYASLSENEIVDYNPTETQLVNATKISGRTSGGWGLGFLNAMTLPAKAIVKDTISGAEHEFVTQPFTNYNVTVIDKSMKNNSYISLINTNMIMADNPFYANVTATDFQIRNKAKTFVILGKAGISARNQEKREVGYEAVLGVDKNSGKLQFGVSETFLDDKFNPRDLGFLNRNNMLNTEAYVNYRIIEPFSIFREMRWTLWYDHNRLFNPGVVTGNYTGLDYYTQFKNNYNVQLNLNYSGKEYDYFEPRVAGRYFSEPYSFSGEIWGSTDSRKAISADADLGGSKQPDTDKYSYYCGLGLDARIGMRFSMYYSINASNNINDRGFAALSETEDTIYFSKRDVNTISNVMGASFIFNNKAGITLRIRHYWSGVGIKEYYQLNDNGTLTSDPGYTENNNENYNAFNVDLNFRWIFAPGSEFTVTWKNSILDYTDEREGNYFDNLRQTWDANQSNSISFRILYYIDYNNLRKKK